MKPCKHKPFKSTEHARTAIYAINSRKGSNARLYPKWCSVCRSFKIAREVK